MLVEASNFLNIEVCRVPVSYFWRKLGFGEDIASLPIQEAHITPLQVKSRMFKVGALKIFLIWKNGFVQKFQVSCFHKTVYTA